MEPGWVQRVPLTAQLMPAGGTEKTVNLITLLKDERLTLGEVEFLENILDKDQEILWSGRPHRPTRRSLLIMVAIWTVVSAAYAWRDIQNDESVVPSIVLSAVLLVLLLIGMIASLRLNSLKPNIIVTTDAVISTTAQLRRISSAEVAILRAVDQQSPIKRTANVALLNPDSTVTVTKNAKVGSLIVESAGASGNTPESKPLKLLYVPDPESLRQVIAKAIAERKHRPEKAHH